MSYYAIANGQVHDLYTIATIAQTTANDVMSIGAINAYRLVSITPIRERYLCWTDSLIVLVINGWFNLDTHTSDTIAIEW